MRYMGSKDKHAKEIIAVINQYRTDQEHWVEPFVGGGNMIEKVKGARIGSDNNQYIIALLTALSEGWVPPQVVTFEKYQEAFNQVRGLSPKLLEDHMIGFIGFGCSFGGKYFGGYARGGYNKDGSPRNYARESSRNMIKMSIGLAGCSFVHSNYEDLVIPSNSIVYCDPPYAMTTKYKDTFDHSKFWKWCEKLVQAGHKVFVSEYNAPVGWKSIWSKKVVSSLDMDTGSKVASENLFTYSN